MPPIANFENDAQLWDAIQRNSEQAFEIFYARYWEAIYTTAYHYLKDKDACTDIVHDIFISIWKKRDHLEVISFQHYLTHAARYRVYKKLQSNRSGKVEELQAWDENNSSASINDGEDKLVYKDLRQNVNYYLEQLPKRCREIFMLSRWENLSNDEIAERLNISKRTVENQLTHALHHLRDAMGEITLAMIILGVCHPA